jgi:effector-binding domain-containing protein
MPRVLSSANASASHLGHGHQMAGPSREVYLTDPDETPGEADHLTEVEFPIRH